MKGQLDLEPLQRIPDPFAKTAGQAAPARAPLDVPSPTRAELRRRRSMAAAAVVLFEVGWVVAVEHRPDLGALPPWRIALALATPLAVAAVALGAAMGQGRRGLGLPAGRLAILATIPAVFFAVATVVTCPPDEDGAFWTLACRCMALTAALTVPPLALGAVVLQRAFPAASIGRTAALGVACGALGAATMSLVCAHSGALHVLVGHGAMMLVGGALGALLGRATRA